MKLRAILVDAACWRAGCSVLDEGMQRAGGRDAACWRAGIRHGGVRRAYTGVFGGHTRGYAPTVDVSIPMNYCCVYCQIPCEMTEKDSKKGSDKEKSAKRFGGITENVFLCIVKEIILG